MQRINIKVTVAASRLKTIAEDGGVIVLEDDLSWQVYERTVGSVSSILLRADSETAIQMPCFGSFLLASRFPLVATLPAHLKRHQKW